MNRHVNSVTVFVFLIRVFRFEFHREVARGARVTQRLEVVDKSSKALLDQWYVEVDKKA